jgi:HSP20 family protein
MVMPIVRWDPFRELVQLRDEIGRWFDDIAERDREERRSAVWTPSVDIKETEKEVLIKADLPGVKMQDIEV